MADRKRVPASSTNPYIRGIKVSDFPVARVRVGNPDSEAERELSAELYRLNVFALTGPDTIGVEIAKALQLLAVFKLRTSFRLRQVFITRFIEELWQIDNIHVRIWLGQLKRSIAMRKAKLERLLEMWEMSQAELAGRPRPTMEEMRRV